MSLQTEQSADLAAIFTELGEALTFSSASIPCAVSFRGQGRKNDMGGFLDEFDATFSVLIADFEDGLPASGHTLTHRSRTYRVERVELGQTNIEARLLCVAVHR